MLSGSKLGEFGESRARATCCKEPFGLWVRMGVEDKVDVKSGSRVALRATSRSLARSLALSFHTTFLGLTSLYPTSLHLCIVMEQLTEVRARLLAMKSLSGLGK